MDIRHMDFMRLLPFFMHGDEADDGLSKGINEVTEKLAKHISTFTTWNKLDEMSVDELDLLAEELHISWYDKTAAADVKRQIIKDSDIVHSKLGTNWATMRVIETYFGEGKIVDWYDYGGNPGHFKIQTINQSIINTKLKKFMEILDCVKRKSAHLDEIELISDGNTNINVFIATVDTEIKTSYISRPIRRNPNALHIGAVDTEIKTSVVQK